MDKTEARRILRLELDAFRARSYAELTALVDSPVIFEREGANDVTYQFEVQAFWDDPRKPGGNLRVLACIDDGRFPAAFVPLSADFIISPDGNFIGE